MAGIYIHIPFCKQKCHYCDFYSVVAEKTIPLYIEASIKEFDLKKNYLSSEIINTIYFGGGTPSILTENDFRRIFDKIFSTYTIAPDAEITIEANPDDLSNQYFSTIDNLPFNRISIGIQSFNDRDLIISNRRHSASQGIEAVKLAKIHGFKNISADLIYGFPNQSINDWKKNLKQIFDLDIQHISVYGLTYEKGTRLWNEKIKGTFEELDDDVMNKMYEITLFEMKNNGFHAYEISNFAKPGFHSRHNSSYWSGENYIGIGPSSHSYNTNSRQWNVPDVETYIQLVQNEDKYFEIEELSIFDKYNDYIMVSLRTSKGVNVDFIYEQFGSEFKLHFLKNVQQFIKNKQIAINGNNYSLTTSGILISNAILVELMRI